MSRVLCKGCSMTFVNCIQLSNSDILQFYVDHGVYNRTRICGNPECKNTLVIKEFSDFVFRCGKYYSSRESSRKSKKVKCRFVASGKKGTFFENAKLSVTQIFYIVATLLCIPAPRQHFIKSNFGLPLNTTIAWYSFCCAVFVDHLSRDNVKLGGVGHEVEIDEAKLGRRRKYHRGSNDENQWVIGGIDRQTRMTFLIPIEIRSTDMLLTIIKERIEPGTKIISNCWRAYNCLNDEGFIRETIDYSKTFVNSNNHGRKEKRFIGYLSEHLFKTKYPDMNDRIHHFWMAAALLYPPQT